MTFEKNYGIIFIQGRERKELFPFALSLPTSVSRKPTEVRALRQWTPLVGQVETKGETDFNNHSQVDAYAWLSSFATRYVVEFDATNVSLGVMT